MFATQENAVGLQSLGSVLNTRNDSWGTTYRCCQKHESLSLHDLCFTGRRLFAISFVTSLKLNLCTVLSIQNTAENDCIISHAQNTTGLRPHVFLIRKHRSMVTKKDNHLSPAQTTAKVNCKLHNHCLYFEKHNIL